MESLRLSLLVVGSCLVLVAGCSVDTTGLRSTDGGQACETVDDCDDGDLCTVDECLAGRCAHADCAPGFTCELGVGCMRPPACDPDVCPEEGRNDELCAVGVCGPEGCVSQPLAECAQDGFLCCGGSCIECPALDPCKVPTCIDGSCDQVAQPDGTACYPNNNFCEGTGECQAGVCTNVMPSCEDSSPEGCDESRDRCTTCSSDAGCPPSVVRVNCDDARAANPTACVIMETEVTQNYRCDAANGLCVENGTTEATIDCSRPEEASCGNVELLPWEVCPWADSCQESGARRSRQVRTPTCRSGTCTDVFTTRTGNCPTRDQTGVDCGPPRSDDWGACGNFMGGVCGEDGERSRTNYDPTCGGGTCNDVTSTETESCTRDTDGNNCGSITNGMWGECVTENECDTTGIQTRTNTRPVCAGGSCSGVTMVMDTRPCTVTTENSPCGMMPGVCTDDGSGTCTGSTQVCQSGSCTAVSCDRNDGMTCEADVLGTCVANESTDNPCDGDQSVTTRVCNAGSCEDAAVSSQTCGLVGMDCSDVGACRTEATCNAAAECVVAVICDNREESCGTCSGMQTCGCDDEGMQQGCECGNF